MAYSNISSFGALNDPSLAGIFGSTNGATTGSAGSFVMPSTGIGGNINSFGTAPQIGYDFTGMNSGDTALTSGSGLGGGNNSGWGSLNTGQKLGIGLQGLQTIGGLIGAFGSLGLARDQFNLQKDVLNTNLKNQIQSYNTSLEDKARSRGVVEGTSAADTQSYIDSHKATR
jgi:hypothetical protein